MCNNNVSFKNQKVMKEMFKTLLLVIMFLPAIILIIVDELLGLNFEIEKDLKEMHPGLIVFTTLFWMMIILT